ncbi:periplasmic solute binding protein [Segniliparus rotundus DSM 44985]|uniref:Periplasmic solute binding protein n=1 Tax=Segniliparus rotundus (strain ATCC BAA-972 / CDC 1076 / CIP 108378 / DSM 44985 / JCM 13578) TaxID=640132 RepID=D6ZAE4_SEGRD|nr:zinc ABC transporter substrate-binding protein [Segniliparus rotundus]ADG96686.1 periplasmic solute binding protein [Segniliparus rotundus DSM 44985]
MMSASPLRRTRYGALALAALALAGCDKSAGGATARTPNIVASTQAWALVAKAVAGEQVPVAVIVGAGKDPHEYQFSSRDAAAVESASVAVMGGKGYDSFMDKALPAGGGPKAIKGESATIVSPELRPKGNAALDNPHVFFDFAVVDAVAHELADELSREDSAHGDLYRHNLRTLRAQLQGFAEQLEELGRSHPGLRAVQTESVGQYLLDYLGASDVTPAGYRAAVANESDPALADQAAAVGLISSRGADLVVDNPQEENKSVNELLAAATSAGVPVVGVGETPPPQVASYSDWLRSILGGFTTALGSPAQPNGEHAGPAR